MATNQLLTTKVVTGEYIDRLENTLALWKRVNHRFTKYFELTPPKGPTGPTIDIRLPVLLNVVNGPTYVAPQAVTQTFQTLEIEFQDVVPLAFTSQDLTLSLDSFKQAFTIPGGEQLANKMEGRIIQKMDTQVANWVGSPGVPLSSYAMVGAANAELNRFGVSQMDRTLALNVDSYQNVVNAVQPGFNMTLNDAASADGRLTRISNFTALYDQNLSAHTVGNYTGSTPLVNGGSQQGATLVTDGWTASTQVLNAGDRFTIAGMFSVNPITKVSTGKLRQFVVTANVTSTAGGVASIPINPAIDSDPTSPYRNVTASPADNAPISILGAANSTYNVEYAFQREAVTVANVELILPKAAVEKAVVSYAPANLSLRMIGEYMIREDQSEYRLDYWFGVAVFERFATAIIT